MPDQLNPKLQNEDTLSQVVGQESFSKLNPSIQAQVVQEASKQKDKDGGWMGKFLGNHPTNVSMHIGFLIPVLLIILIMIDTIHSYRIGQAISLELVKTVLPVITLSLGYIFGKNSD